MKTMLSAKKAADIAGVTSHTIRDWANRGKLNFIRTEGGHRRFNSEDLSKLLGYPVSDIPIDSQATRQFDLTNQIFGRLTVLRKIEKPEYITSKRKCNYWLCKCECGNEVISYTSSLTGGDTKSCGCLYKGSSAVKRCNPKGDAAKHAVFCLYRYKAHKRKLEFNLSEDEFVKICEEKCSYCGRSPFNDFSVKTYNGGFIYNGVDRVDNSLGYSVNNCVPCCKNCNMAKSNMTLDEFRNWISLVYNNMILEKSL